MLIVSVVGGIVLAGMSLPWLASHAGLGAWKRRWRLEPTSEALSGEVLVVVPARDEAEDIGGCVAALLAGPVTRVRVVDDGSTDGTGEVARAAARGDPRLEVTPAPPRPQGFAGKAWACLAGSTGDSEWLLFVDADVRLDPRAAATLVSFAEREQGDLVSVFGTWEVEGVGERLLVPAFGWLIRGAVPMAAVEAGKEAFANGQVILIRRHTYDAIGGHEAVRDDVLDDVGLARAVLRAGGRLGLRWAPWAFRLRPYRGSREVIRGYAKNLGAGLDRSRSRALVAAILLAGATAGPVAMVLIAALVRDPLLAAGALVVLLLQISLRARLEILDGRSPWIAPLHPVAGLVMAWTVLRSAFGGTVRWKGRAFRDGRPAEERG